MGVVAGSGDILSSSPSESPRVAYSLSLLSHYIRGFKVVSHCRKANGKQSKHICDSANMDLTISESERHGKVTIHGGP